MVQTVSFSQLVSIVVVLTLINCVAYLNHLYETKALSEMKRQSWGNAVNSSGFETAPRRYCLETYGGKARFDSWSKVGGEDNLIKVECELKQPLSFVEWVAHGFGKTISGEVKT